MIKLHITKINNKILIPENEFEQLVKSVKNTEDVLIENGEFLDLSEASSTGLDFWDNEIDEKIWNNA